MMADLISGRLDAAMLSTPLAKSYLVDKRLKALAIDARTRWSIIPEAPTLAELGHGDATVASWFGVSAPPGTPEPILRKLQAAFAASGREPSVKEKIRKIWTFCGIKYAGRDGRCLMVQETQEIGRLVRLLGLRKP